MASQDEGPLHVSWPGIVALVVAALGLIVSRPSLDSPRPTLAAADGKSIPPGKGVPARLWQDPLATALRGPKPKGGFAAVVDSRHRPEPPKVGGDQDKQVLFLLDCVEPENTPEAAENRRRERYAVLSALNTAGYTPTHPDRIYAVAPPRKGQPEVDPSQDDKRIPYEWAEPLRDENGRISEDIQFQAVCVLWVSPRPDDKHQLDFLARLSRHLKVALSKCKDSPTCKFAIAGRITSTQLATMLREEAGFDDPVTLYVTYSTAPSVRRRQLTKQLFDSRFALEYVIDTDQFLAQKLICELKRRGIHPEQSGSLAIIAEWDTEYGREMHQVFGDATSREPKNDATCPKPKNVRHYSYLRGLDGKELGGVPGDRNEKPSSNGNGESSAGQKPAQDRPTAKEGEGEPQIDYLRRLARRMKEEDTQYDYPLAAIGIVGNDVYDKLLLLRALRPVFPEAVFFTTDLDVRLLQPGEYSDTRNLVIASHYGLSLNTSLQGKVAPFRSSYDTASYLGCLRAVKFDKMRDHPQYADHAIIKRIRPIATIDGKEVPCNGHLLVPNKGSDRMPIHLYEVGHSGAYELTLREGDQLEPPNPRLCPWLLRGGKPYYLLGMALIAGMLLYPVSRPWQRFLKSVTARSFRLLARRGGTEEKPGRRDSGRALLWVGGLVAGGLTLLLAILIYVAHTTEGQESFELYEGVSVWPTVIFRLLAAGLCVYYLARAFAALAKRNQRIHQEFSFAAPAGTYPGRGLRGAWAALRESCQAWTREPTKAREVRKLFEEFAEHGVPWRRTYRTGLLAALNLALFVLLWRLFDSGIPQARGLIAQTSFIVVLVLTLLTLPALLMFVVDSTLLSYRFVAALVGQRERAWPASLLADGARKWGMELPIAEEKEHLPEAGETPQAVGQWLSIRLIDAVTNVVAGRLIYYPFVVLLVLIVAQNRLFDNWHWTTPLALMALFNAGVAIVCAVLLQNAAKRARARALSALDDLLRARIGPPHDSVREKMGRIRSEIKAVNTGAFANWSQNPVIGAVLLPLMGGGGLAALEALLRYLANP
jgi:hypothetical protein